MRNPGPPVVQLRGITRQFHGHKVIEGLDLDICPGEFVVLLGASGSGKTTLLRLLAGLDRADAGSLLVPAAVATVFQEPRLMPWMRVLDNVTLGVRAKDARSKAQQALAEVGLNHRVGAWPSTLSGGEAQRTALARGLIRQPQLFLLDEPFAALDALTRIRMHALLLNIWVRHNPAILLVTHDINEAVLLADRIVVLKQGSIEQDIRVPWPRPRQQGAADFDQVRKQLLAMLGVFDGVADGLVEHFEALPARQTVS